MEEQLKKLIKEAVREVLEEMEFNNHTRQYSPSDCFPEIMNIKQAAEFVHLTESYIKNKKAELAIPHRRKGRSYLFLKSELIEWLQQREEEKKPKISMHPAKTKRCTTRLV